MVWNDAHKNSVTIDTGLWNKYIMATCNAYPKFWKRWANGEVKARDLRLFNPGETPVATNNAPVLMQAMIESHVKPNFRTYELLLLYFAQQTDVDSVRRVVETIWGISMKSKNDVSPIFKGSHMFPELSTLTALVNGFAVNDKLIEGLYYMDRMRSQFGIDVTNNASIHLWGTILNWILLTREPKGHTPPEVFDKIWALMTEAYNIKPNSLMYRARARHLLSRRDYEGLIADIPQILGSDVEFAAEVASLNLKRAAQGYARQGKVDKALALVEKWAQVGPAFAAVKDKVTEYINTSTLVSKQMEIAGNERHHHLEMEGELAGTSH